MGKGHFEITKEEWHNYCELQWKCTNTHTWREFAWECLITFSTTPKMKTHCTGEDPICWKGCGGRDATHRHIFWECPGLQNFWSEVHKAMEEMFHKKVPNHFEIFILDKSAFITGNTNRHLFVIMITEAKKNVTRHWLHPEPPTLNLQMDRLNKIWAKWISFIENS